MSHELAVRVYYEDTDMGGIVYYANYLKYIERARSELVEDLGMNQLEMREAGVVFVVTRVVADYLGSARLDDRLTVLTEHRPKGPVRWIFDQEVRRGDEVLFRAEVTAACMTLDGRPTRLPPQLRD
ncbi:tol-pal system-associated acyl-CoA thioesterase [Salipiger sp. IMCC34102]|uniref:tol-pal system-associated acyl-CoA thioesterase n=1 Tax=Salipiger sp. IMCC34102 TaxID=2510647 RepID=UPI00101E1585|nr:tol-pal system-associated acyl-CoA thioesterase [Salipiger sp. IMCC34102]RYH01156.1 tol-pal system-associated acyl-CoA thioesterase [Salipiger sp. IMCC34102]